MMSVFEYAEDIKKSVDEVLRKCDSLDILVNGESDLLDEDAITMLDSAFAEDGEIDEVVESNVETSIEEIYEDSIINNDNSEKVKKI